MAQNIKDIEMIAITLPRVKTGPSWKESVVKYTPVVPMSTYSNQFEETRRNKLIKHQAQTSGLTVGMRVRPANEDEFKRRGYATVYAVASSYNAYKSSAEKEPWPANDMPFIVHVKYETGDSSMVLATYNYFIPAGEK